jgi:tetratricopeptide (TPR) repeat protein
MVKLLLTISCLICLVLIPNYHVQAAWDEARLNKAIQKYQRAGDKKQWELAIKYGEKALKGCLALYSESDYRCIIIRKNNSVHYLKLDRHVDRPTEVQMAYEVARAAKGTDHYLTRSTREVYYMLLLRQKKFREAIPILEESLKTALVLRFDPFKTLDIRLQLYGLYHIVKDTKKEQAELESLLPMAQKLLGENGEDAKAISEALGRSYCDHNQYDQWTDLKASHGIEGHCLWVAPGK